MKAYIAANVSQLLAFCLGVLAASYVFDGALNKSDLAVCLGALGFFLAQAISHRKRAGKEASNAH